MSPRGDERLTRGGPRRDIWSFKVKVDDAVDDSLVLIYLIDQRGCHACIARRPCGVEGCDYRYVVHNLSLKRRHCAGQDGGEERRFCGEVLAHFEP